MKVFSSTTCKILLCAFIFSPKICSQSTDPDPIYVLKQVVNQSKQIKTLRYHAIMNERIDGKMVQKDSYFKINVDPLKIYVSQSFLGIKIDALYVEGWNNNELLVATVGFPWIQLSLDPKGKRVRDNHHHTIFEAGFGYFASVIDQLLKYHKDKITIDYQGITKVYNKDCYKIRIIVNHYQIISYTVQKGETLPSIAQRMLINDYKILELNPDIADYSDIRPGQVIKIPNLYAKVMYLYVDVSSFLPVQIELHDEKGLYAIYGYNNVIINTPFAPDEFDKSYKNYHFR
ncbi:MAG: DUF1571 domain-containing protein [Bacteroidales bacterium]|nr:DUF1571 domain-containing protein [Bacteroidales bacterium]